MDKQVAYIGVKGIPGRGGAEKVVEAIASRVSQGDITPTIYCDSRYTPVGYTMPGVKIVRLITIPGKYFRSTALDLLAALHAVFFGKYDLVHLHNVEASFVLPFLRLRYPVISTSHGSAYWRAKWGKIARTLISMMDVPFMKLSNEVTFVSYKDAVLFKNRFHRDVHYIPNGVGTENVPNLDLAKALLKEHNLFPKNYFLFVAGRIEPTKGAHIAIEAVRQLESDECLLIIGDHSHSPKYSQALKESAGPRIIFISFVNDPGTLLGTMKMAKALVFPSLVEAMSMVLLEAASTGVPIVCSDIEENRQVLGENAVYFPSGDVSSLAQQLEWVSEHYSAAETLGCQAKTAVNDEYSWYSITNQYLKLYNCIIDKKNERTRNISM